MVATKRHRTGLLLLAAAATMAFVATFVVLTLVNSGSGPAPARQLDGAAPARTTDGQIAQLQAQVRKAPKQAGLWAELGETYLQKVRETGDASFYTRADGVLRRALALEPQGLEGLVGAGTLALARHDFSGGLRYGLAAHRVAPGLARPLGVIVDAQVELGRYGDAARTLQHMVDLQPNLASYARISYFRELHGDLGGALYAMRLAVSSGGGAPENVAYVQTLLGNLLFERGDLRGARAAYEQAIARFPNYVPAGAGLAKVDAADGRLESAIRHLRDAVARLPLPEYVVALGETEQAAGRAADARRDLALVGAEEKLLRASGVNTDVDLALFEANHGSPARGVTLARRAWAEAPSVRSADALGWALTRSGHPAAGLRWAKRALRLGSVDPTFRYHAGMTARATGRTALARAWLRQALANNPRFSPLYAPRAQAALVALR
jgi:tetratricopeptide (TPR) repeat protein